MSAWIAAGSSFAFTHRGVGVMNGGQKAQESGGGPTQPAGVAQAGPVAGMRDSGRMLSECGSRRWLSTSSSSRPSQALCVWLDDTEAADAFSPVGHEPAPECNGVQPGPVTRDGCGRELTTLRSLVGSSSGLIHGHMESRMNTEGAALLKEAYREECVSESLAPQKPGVFKIFLNGRLMTLGKAEDGLRKRFSDLYRGLPGGTAGKKEIGEDNRDKVVVWWKQCSRKEGERLRICMLSECLEAGGKLPWLHRRRQGLRSGRLLPTLRR